MRTAEFVERHRASAAFSEMMLEIWSAGEAARKADPDYIPFNEWRLLCVIRVNDERGGLPLSARQLGRKAGGSESHAKRLVKNLVRRGAIMEQTVRGKTGYVGDDRYLMARMHSPYFRRMAKAVCTASPILHAYLSRRR